MSPLSFYCIYIFIHILPFSPRSQCGCSVYTFLSLSLIHCCLHCPSVSSVVHRYPPYLSSTVLSPSHSVSPNLPLLPSPLWSPLYFDSPFPNQLLSPLSHCLSPSPSPLPWPTVVPLPLGPLSSPPPTHPPNPGITGRIKAVSAAHSNPLSSHPGFYFIFSVYVSKLIISTGCVYGPCCLMNVHEGACRRVYYYHFYYYEYAFSWWGGGRVGCAGGREGGRVKPDGCRPNKRLYNENVFVPVSLSAWKQLSGVWTCTG